MSRKKRVFGKAFARRAIFFSTIAMLILTGLGLILYGRRATILTKQAERAAGDRGRGGPASIPLRSREGGPDRRGHGPG